MNTKSSVLSRLVFSFLVCALLIGNMSIYSPALAATPESTPNKPSSQLNIPNEEKKTAVSLSIPVTIERQGTDTLGAALAMELQEVFNKGTLCKLTTKEEPKVLVLVSTMPEFASRPQVGSAYSVTWLYYEGPKSFNSYLANEVGIVTPEDTKDVALKIAERTITLSTRYNYLFQK